MYQQVLKDLPGNQNRADVKCTTIHSYMQRRVIILYNSYPRDTLVKVYHAHFMTLKYV